MNYEVKEGDCLASIAAAFGLGPAALWADQGNAALRRQREDPNVLRPGDVLHIPERRPQTQPAATEARHRYVRIGTPALFRVVVCELDVPITGEAYELDVDGTLFDGVTGDDGTVEHWISPLARRATLTLHARDLRYEISLGALEPANSLRGAQQRLNNLGLGCGAEDGDAGPLTRAALALFQARQGLERTGELDGKTVDALREAHGS